MCVFLTCDVAGGVSRARQRDGVAKEAETGPRQAGTAPQTTNSSYPAAVPTTTTTALVKTLPESFIARHSSLPHRDVSNAADETREMGDLD